MRKFLFIVIFYTPLILFAQADGSCPVNLDFELGNFTGWKCYTGTASSGNPNTLSTPTSGRHEITSTFSGNDFFGGFPQLCPYGGLNSIKLGNNISGNQAEKVTYTFTVPVTTNNDFSLTYFYAVVLEEPPSNNPHSTLERPKFRMKCVDAVTGNNVGCSVNDFVAGSTLPGFTQSSIPGSNNSIIWYKNWTPNTIDLSGLGGTQIRLEFSTFDCTLGGHFGYAYIDVATNCNSVLAAGSVCSGGGGELILNAPSGLQSYTWWDANYTTIIGSTQNILMNPSPPLGTVFHVDMIPYPGYGCRDTADALVTLVQAPDTPTAITRYNYCHNQGASQLTATASPGNYLQWYTTAIGGTPSLLAPTPSTATVGSTNYYVAQKNPQSCESVRKRITVTINPNPAADFTINTNRQCLPNNSFVFNSVSLGVDPNSTYEWNFGDGQTDNTPITTTHSYATDGVYNVTLKVTNLPSCANTSSGSPATIISKPIAQFSFSDTICSNQTLINLVDNSYTPGPSSNIADWWWNINGTIHTIQSPPAFTSPAGNLTIKLAVQNADGCFSDTTIISKTVHHNPQAKFDYSKVQCDNEVMYFTDKSFIPNADADENINTWNWVLSNGINPNTQNTQGIFPIGFQNAQLKVSTNFGCSSIVTADSFFTIYGKPAISVTVSDSCVNRAINFTTTDLSGTVNNWWWNFGGGWYQAPSVITKTYSGVGYKPFRVAGQTAFGCKDTVLYKFSTFSNHAFAGRDTITTRGEPVKLNGTGGLNYEWTPAIGLSNPFIANPVATYDQDVLYTLHAISKEGCDSYDDIFIKRYKGPALYVPTAFTPNNDGTNDILKVFPVGIEKFGSFSVYDRNGIRVFYTTDYRRGWDGTIKGREAESGTYVFIANGTNYLGKYMEEKGSVVLIR